MQAAKNGWTILVGEDEAEVRSYLETALRCDGYSVALAQNGEEVLSVLQESETRISAVMLDILMPRKDGLETLREIRRINPGVPVIMVSGLSAPLNVVEAMKCGANDYLPKPVDHEDLLRTLRTLLRGTIPETLRPPRPQPAQSGAFCWGSNPAIKHIESLCRQIGQSDTPVLIHGETGVGKEVLARELHAQSRRSRKPFLKLNCAALPSELVESELFGYERGAFTGAFQRKPGMFEVADTGTILLDEIGDMDIKLQAKLLQVLQDGEFQRLGGRDIVRVDVRVLAATHRDLEKAIAADTFREDLYYRLNVIKLYIPPLRDRKEDILPIAMFLMDRHTVAGTPAPSITPPLREAFLRYDWPGNVRELENVLRRFLILRDAEVIVAELEEKVASRSISHAKSASLALPAQPFGGPAVLEQVREANEKAERTAILTALSTTRWNRKQAAAVLTIDYKALLYKMKKLQIDGTAEEAGPPPPKAMAAGTSEPRPAYPLGRARSL